MKKFCKIEECASLVFEAYRAEGYYSLSDYRKAATAYREERNKLLGFILTDNNEKGQVIGTLMIARDRGWLPTDIAFSREMVSIRKQYGERLGYIGKFAVDPSVQGDDVGKRLIAHAVSCLSLRNNVNVVVMMVHPRHAPRYKRLGAREIARTEGTAGMEKAPAILLVLDFEDLFRIVRERQARFETCTNTPNNTELLAA